MLKRIVDILGWLGTALVSGAVVARFVKPDLQQVWYWLAVAGLVCVLLYILGQWRDILRLFGRRQAKYGTLAATSILLVVGILVAINYVSSRRGKRWDLTAAQQFTLAEQTRKVLESLEAPVKILVFAREDEFGRFRDRLSEYQNASNNVSVEYVDMDKKPLVARQYGAQSYGTVVFDYQGRVERVVADTEQELTNTLIKAVEGRQRKTYFIQGHGEKDIRSSERDGYGGIIQALGGDNFEVDTLVLAQKSDVPADATAVVVAGPRTDYFPTEIDALRRYLRRGGKALFLLDPPQKPDAPEIANLVALLKEWAIEVGNNLVVDLNPVHQLLGTDASVPVAAKYSPHPITERFNLMTAYPLARSINPVSGGVDGRTAQTFVETSEDSWAETDIRGALTGGGVKPEEDRGDKRGPISLAAAVSAEAAETPPPSADEQKDQKEGSEKREGESADQRKPETRVVAIGDSDFATNAFLNIQGNRDFFLNAMSWLAQQENLIAIRPREPEDRRITLNADQQRRIFWLSLLIIPGLVLASGVYAWWRRR